MKAKDLKVGDKVRHQGILYTVVETAPDGGLVAWYSKPTTLKINDQSIDLAGASFLDYLPPETSVELA